MGESTNLSGRHTVLLSTRDPRAVKFKINDKDPNDQYALLYSDPIVDSINKLTLPRYGLEIISRSVPMNPTAAEARVIADLSRAGKRLMGFCRTNFFKRLESSGQAFLQSVERHILRNYVYLYAIENNETVPIGTQDASLLDDRFNDADSELLLQMMMKRMEGGESLNQLNTEEDLEGVRQKFTKDMQDLEDKIPMVKADRFLLNSHRIWRLISRFFSILRKCGA
jgi:hypothetical protein